ncbi:MAG: hypothetical protein HOV94_31920, partial [Saccharothrix sp.]|nr:hypothetical protein [Saccharothrix sp.]
MSELERRYRRLLALYPRDHRERHGAEMLAVVVAAAGDRTRPGVKNTADLLWGALRLHARRLVETDARDVLAIVSVLGPVAILAGASPSLHELAWWVRARSVPPFEQIPDAPVWFAWLAVAVLALTGRRRAAAIVAWVGAAGLVALMVQPYMQWRWTTTEAGWVLLGVITAIALTRSPRTAPGRAPVWVMAAAVGVYVLLEERAHGVQAAFWAAHLGYAFGAVAAAARFGSAAGFLAGLVLLAPIMTT